MTIRNFGRVVPIQIYLLQLVGYEWKGRSLDPATGGNARKRAMRDGLRSLQKSTGTDFGYNPAAWREYLISTGEEAGYTHPYAFALVDQAVCEALEDPTVIAPLKELSESDTA